MVNDKSLENLKPNVFSKDNQPTPEAKSKPKYKTQLKRFIEDNIGIVKEQMLKGNSKFWDIAFERGYGKVKDKIEHSGKIDFTDIKQMIKDNLNLNDSLNEKTENS